MPRFISRVSVKKTKKKKQLETKYVLTGYNLYIPAMFSSSIRREGACRGHAESIRAGSQWDAVSHWQASGSV